jgi:hypothetical protein
MVSVRHETASSRGAVLCNRLCVSTGIGFSMASTAIKEPCMLPNQQSGGSTWSRLGSGMLPVVGAASELLNLQEGNASFASESRLASHPMSLFSLAGECVLLVRSSEKKAVKEVLRRRYLIIRRYSH